MYHDIVRLMLIMVKISRKSNINCHFAKVKSRCEMLHYTHTNIDTPISLSIYQSIYTPYISSNNRWTGMTVACNVIINRNLLSFQSNKNTASVEYTPKGEDHEKFLSCRGVNPHLPNLAVEDQWKIIVHGNN